MSSLSHPSSASETVPLASRSRSRANSDVGTYRPSHLKHRRFISSALFHTHTLPEVGQCYVQSRQCLFLSESLYCDVWINRALGRLGHWPNDATVLTYKDYCILESDAKKFSRYVSSCSDPSGRAV